MLREFAAKDTDEVIDVWYRASLLAHPFLSDTFLESERSEIAETWLPVAKTSVYEVDGRVVGFISIIGNEVGGIFVDPNHQRRGVGRALMDHALITRSTLELNVFEENEAARRFYSGFGFELIGRDFNVAAGQTELRLKLS